MTFRHLRDVIQNFPICSKMAVASRHRLRLEILDYNLVSQTQYTETSVRSSPKSSKIAYYVITVKFGTVEYTLERRFREFDAFYEKYMHDLFKNVEFPAKTFGRKNETKFLEERQEQLHRFVEACSDVYHKLALYSEIAFIDFFELYRAECYASLIQLKRRLELYHADSRDLSVNTLQLWSLTHLTKDLAGSGDSQNDSAIYGDMYGLAKKYKLLTSIW